MPPQEAGAGRQVQNPPAEAPADDAGLFVDSNPDKIPQALKDLMKGNHVTEWDIQNVVAARGYYPGDVPVEKYDAGFIDGVLVGAWGKVFKMIQEMREKQEIPFN